MLTAYAVYTARALFAGPYTRLPVLLKKTLKNKGVLCESLLESCS